MSATVLAVILLLRPASGDTLELEMKNGVQLFLERNQTLGAARYEVDATKGELTTTSLRPNPQFSVNTSYIGLLKRPIDYSATQTSARIDQTFELGGKRGYRIEAGEHSVTEATDEFLDARHQLVDDFREWLLSAAFAEQTYQLAEENYDISSKLKDAAAKRLDAGDIGEQEYILSLIHI